MARLGVGLDVNRFVLSEPYWMGTDTKVSFGFIPRLKRVGFPL
jgi:hypothetical protein